MEIYNGKSVYGGIAIGKIAVIGAKEEVIVPVSVANTAYEKERFKKALLKSKEQLSELYSTAVETVGKESAEIFEIHKMMLEDTDYIENVEKIIDEEKIMAEYAVSKTGQEFSERFLKMDSEYMRERSADVTDISQRVISNLKGKIPDGQKLREKVIIVAEDLTPSETIGLDRKNILAFVTAGGSTLSHTAILAGIMNIPAIVASNIPVDNSLDGSIAAVDAYSGKIYINPDNALLTPLRKRLDEDKKRYLELSKLRGMETKTKDGKKISLLANISSSKDVSYALENDAEGIGLFRSEFLYVGRTKPPSEEEQFEAYKEVAQKMQSKTVIIRTFDLGADKRADYLTFEDEENPALGVRGIRLSLENEEIFKTQLRAIYRASVYGNISIMYPMIISEEEVKRAKLISKQVRNELKEKNILFGNVEEGVMIETPAAALISDKLARMVDFFSIGTNDLTQYTLAVDRQNSRLGNLYDVMHPSVLNLIKMTCENAHKNSIWVGVCGEMGGSLDACKTLLSLGIDELSVSPTKILPLRETISKIEVFPKG